MVEGLSAGTHTFAIETSKESQPEHGLARLEVDGSGNLLSYISVTRWVLQEYGELDIFVAADGQRMDGSARVFVEGQTLGTTTEVENVSNSNG